MYVYRWILRVRVVGEKGYCDEPITPHALGRWQIGGPRPRMIVSCSATPRGWTRTGCAASRNAAVHGLTGRHRTARCYVLGSVARMHSKMV